MTADILTPAAIDDTSLADATALVERLRGRGVVLSLDDTGNLSVRAPKGTLGDDDRQSLLRHKAALVHILSGRVVAGDFPLTDIQQAYWVGRRSVELGGVGCHAYREFHRVDLDVDRLQAAWAQLIRRHGMLRCVIGEEGRQRILHEPPEYCFAVTDLSELPDDVASARLATLRDEMSHHAFDPSVWPMFDIRITRLADGWRIHMGMDLLIADAASMLTLYREWGALYDNPDAALPPLVRQFADFVLHGGQSVADQQRAASYWRKRLDDLPGPPDLPLAKSPSEIAKPRFTRHSHTLSPDRWQALKQRARSHGLTPSALLAAAYGDVLAAWSRHQHFLITLTAFRAPPDFANVVGDFTSTILLEIDGRAARFVDRARKTQQRLAEDLEHDGWSGVAVARELARHTGRMIDSIPVVFTSALGRHAGADSTLPIAWLGETVHAITQTPQVWMDHHVIEDGDALIVSWDAVEELFHPGDIARMFAAYTGFLNDLADDDRHWQASLGRHVPKDQLALRQTVNDTAAPLPTGLLHQAILDVAAQSPDRVAIIAPDRSLTFADLIGHAAAVARQVSATLTASGVTETRDRLVGVAIAKGWRQVVAVLGVMMAGAAYLPVDPTLPSARRRYLVENGELACVLGEPANAGLDWPDGVPVLLVDDIAPLPADMVSAGPAGAGDLAYVIYTSGSTGEPKGVMIEHQAALNTVLDINRRFGISGDSVVLGLSSLSFDLSVYDIFGVLGAGGRLVLPAADRLRDPGHWLDAMRRHGVTVWNSAPALLSMLVEHGGGDNGGEVGPDLKTVMLSGDWIPLGLPARIKAMAPNATVWALGGATEASIWSNWFEVRRIGDDWRSIPYGWPLTNQFYQILNDVLEPVPVGVTGRLFIGGYGLARGYWRDPARSAARFITHPVSGARLYETGDLARYLPDGAIEFLGREDSQVKINGHRIEPGEIEAALASHPDVGQAVVVAVGRSGPGHERRLAAYVVTDDKSEAPQPSTESTRGPAPFEAGALLGGPSRLALLLSQPARRAAGGVRVALTGDVPPATTRRTVRQFSPAPVPLAELGRWLAALRTTADPASPLPRYRYASAGSSYAVQVWLQIKPGRVEGLEGGLYYHHADRHDLEYCGPAVALDSSSHAPANRAAFDSAAFSVCLVACYPAIRPLYGERARDFCLIEAGYMGQLLMDQAARGGLGLCAIGALDSSALTGPLELGEERELLHSFVGGLPARGDEIPTSPGTQVTTDITGELRGWLADRLPSYMIPDAILRLAALPVTANGKLDRARLPDPGLITERRQQQTEAAQPPVGGLEEVIAAVFCTVLDRSSVGRDQPVFDLGGTSVHMVRIHRRLTEQLGRSFDIVDLFRYPTVAGLAAWLGQGDGDGGGGGAPGLSGSGAGAASGAARAAARRNLRDRRGMA